MHDPLQRTIDALVLRFDAIPDERRSTLERVATFIAERTAEGESTKLTFICTHNLTIRPIPRLISSRS